MQLETSPELSQMATPITQLYSAVSNMHIQVLLLDMCSKNIPIEVGKNKQHLHEKGVPIFFFSQNSHLSILSLHYRCAPSASTSRTACALLV